MAEQLADGRPIGVGPEVPGQVAGGQVVERELAGPDHQHHLGCDHRLGNARDRELVLDDIDGVATPWGMSRRIRLRRGRYEPGGTAR